MVGGWVVGGRALRGLAFGGESAGAGRQVGGAAEVAAPVIPVIVLGFPHDGCCVSCISSAALGLVVQVNGNQ